MDFSRRATVVAPRLLGCVLRVGDVAVRLTEVEAYEGSDDPASHAWRGPTKRTAVMFGPPGHLYVYLSYGLHACCNIVCGPDGRASAVLLRAGEVVDGIDVARARRGDVPDVRLAKGPGNLARALGLTTADSGRPLGVDGVELLARKGKRGIVASGPRVGVSRAAEEPLRFWLDSDPTVSAYSRSPRAPRARPGTVPDPQRTP